jgi:hypothetical protein
VGYFYAKRSPDQKIIGVGTDFRRAREGEGTIVNSMIECACDWIVSSREELLKGISKFF